MTFHVIKKFNVKSKNSNQLLGIVIFILILPLLLLFAILGLLAVFFIWIISFFNRKSIKTISEIKKEETFLLTNEAVSIKLIEDETDKEYNELSDAWSTQVYDEDIFVYRAATVPEIAELNNKFITTFIKETSTGAFLQIVVDDKVDSNLVFLRYSDLSISFIDNVGAFFLYLDKGNPDVIKGFNESNEIELHLSEKNGV